MSSSSFVLAGNLIMLIDDDPSFVASLTKLFRDNGAEVITAVNSEEAYREIKHVNPDIILCGYNLSDGMNGEELLNDLSFIKKKSPVCILLTDDLSLKLTAVDDIAVGLLKKSFSLDELFEVVVNARKSLDYLKQVVNIDAYRFKELELTLKIGQISVVGEFVEATANSVIIGINNQVAKEDRCHILIKNFLNNSQTEYFIEGNILSIDHAEEDYYLVEILVDNSFIESLKKLNASLDKKQNEIMDFIKKVNG